MKAANNLRRMIFDRPWRHAAGFWSLLALALTSVLCRFYSFLSSILHLRSSIPSPRALLSATVALALTANIASTLATYPHTLSYFNELAGGPLNGPAHLLDANVDWEQDLLYLKEWYDSHREAQPLSFAWCGFIDPRFAGIDYEQVASAPRCPRGTLAPGPRRPVAAIEPAFDWYAVGVNDLYGYKHVDDISDELAWLRPLPVASFIGYSIVIKRGPRSHSL
jgi:hypothetical protein